MSPVKSFACVCARPFNESVSGLNSGFSKHIRGNSCSPLHSVSHKACKAALWKNGTEDSNLLNQTPLGMSSPEDEPSPLLVSCAERSSSVIYVAAGFRLISSVQICGRLSACVCRFPHIMHQLAITVLIALAQALGSLPPPNPLFLESNPSQISLRS